MNPWFYCCCCRISNAGIILIHELDNEFHVTVKILILNVVALCTIFKSFRKCFFFVLISVFKYTRKKRRRCWFKLLMMSRFPNRNWILRLDKKRLFEKWFFFYSKICFLIFLSEKILCSHANLNFAIFKIYIFICNETKMQCTLTKETQWKKREMINCYLEKLKHNYSLHRHI